MSSTSLETSRASIFAMAEFVTTAKPPAKARETAATALCDTVGVILAGVVEPASGMMRELVSESSGSSRVLGTSQTAGAAEAALANGVAAHAIDFDDMCFVSMAHPSCALVPAVLAAGELANASGKQVLEAYIVGFEIECRLGIVMNPQHYHKRGWHATSSIGTVGAAAAAARLLGLTAGQVVHALGIAASMACGVKENIGTMVKPLHAGVAARNGVMAARLAKKGFTASEKAFDGPQGYLIAMDSGKPAEALDEAVADLGSRWEILDTGVTVKLYPSCAATHPPLDAVLEIVKKHGVKPADVAAVDVEMDTIGVKLLIYPQPTTGLEGKFSMPFCTAAAMIHGHPTTAMFDTPYVQDKQVQELGSKVTLRVNTAFDTSAPLSQSRVTMRLADGRTVTEYSDGARGYPGRLTKEELAAKFRGCAERALSREQSEKVLEALLRVDSLENIATLTALCATNRS
jgi:2-methylcitrate dehydratase PrpD